MSEVLAQLAKLGGSGDSLLKSGEYIYCRFTLTTITESKKGTFVSGVSRNFSQNLCACMYVNVEGFSTFTFLHNGSARTSGIALNKDGTISNLTGNTSNNVSNAAYVLIGATTSGSQNWTITLS